MASDSQSQILTFPFPSTPRVASPLINACLMHVSQLSGINRKKSKNHALLDDLGRFRLWAHGFDPIHGQSHDISEGGTSAVNTLFDEVLERSEYLKEPTMVLLASFAGFLLLAKFKKSIPNDLVCPLPLSSSINYSIVGNDKTRALVDATLNDAIMLYPPLGNDHGDADSDQSWMSAVEELHDIVGSLFTLAEPLNNVLQKLQVRMNTSLPPVMECYKNIIIDKFPNAELDLVWRIAEGNAECHEQLRSEQTVVIDIPALSEIESYLQPSFHDSGLGSSRPSGLSLVPPPSVAALSVSTAFSAFTTAGDRPSLPNMPPEHDSRFGFTCPVCSQTQKPIINNRQWRKHVFADLRPYMCTYDGCPTPKQSYQSIRVWIAHQSSHHTPGDLSTASCVFCMRQFESRDTQFYRHVGHHMEDIRLFCLPPSHRQSDDKNDGIRGLDNSSDTERHGDVSPGGLGALASVEEEASAPGILEQFVTTNNQPDKVRFLGDWLTGTGVASVPEILETGSLTGTGVVARMMANIGY